MKYRVLMLPALALMSAGVFITSCKDDDPPPVPAQLSFSTTTLTAKESDDVLSIDVLLDKAASEDITIDYTLSGTAVDKVTDGDNYDYTVTSSYLTVDIPQGETKGTITIDPSSDLEFELDETIIVKIDKVSSTNVTITRDDELTITLKQEDGMAIILSWPDPVTGGAQADMDLILRGGATTTTLESAPFHGSAIPSTTGPEGIFLPNVITIPAYGVSYTYYDGNIDPLEFEVAFANYVNGAFEPEANWLVYNATYTAANKNKWTDPSTTLVVQTFEKTDAGFSTPSQITVPATGSRYANPAGINSSSFKKGSTPSTYKFDPSRFAN